MMEDAPVKGIHGLKQCAFLDVLLGRRSRRFFKGAEIPDGVFKFKSRHEIQPLSEMEKHLVLLACTANTSWHHLIYRAREYAPSLSNYATTAHGRTFPSAAGFHTSAIFFTDDNGTYFVDNRARGPYAERDSDGELDLEALMAQLQKDIQKIDDKRLYIPKEPPCTEPHNTWVVNYDGSLLVIPVGDLAQHVLAGLCYYLQNKVVFYDNINGKQFPGIEQFRAIADIDHPMPLTFLEQWSMAEITAELSTSCYAGALMLQAMGLGGWMFDGLDPFSVMGASGNPDVMGLGFRYDTSDLWPYPNPTGLEGFFEAFCPPHYATMRDAVDALCEKKFGSGGPFHPETAGPFKDTAKVRAAARVHNEEFRQCVALQAQYIFDTFGKFPGTVPSMFLLTYLQAHHLDLEFYDKFFKPGAYLRTHAQHDRIWH
jgi:hypothetical protein